MEITQQNLSVLFTQAEVRFGEALKSTPVWTPELATVFPSGTAQNIYAWMDRIPVLRQWLGDRVINAITTHAVTVPNIPFELTDAIAAEDIRRDQYGLFNMNLQFMAMQAGKWSDQQLAYYLINQAAAAAQGCSKPTAGYDGKTLFAADHPTLGGDTAGGIPSGVASTQSNLFLNRALTYENYVYVREQMLSMKGADGQPLYNAPDLLVIPPQLEGKAKNILESDFLAGVNGVDTAPQSNVYKNTAKIKVLQELSSRPNCWYLMCTTNVVRPLIWQLEKAPVFTYLTNPTDLPVFMSRQFVYGVEAWGAPAASLWFLASAGTSAATYAG